jgi:hypothetical protein
VSAQVELLPLQPPPAQLAKVAFAAGVSVSVTEVPEVKLAPQVGAQLIPEGTLATVPVPVPARTTVSITALGMALKVAVTCWLALSVTVQVELLPLQPPPDHPAKDEFAAAVSVSVTEVPEVKLALQVGAQAIPEGVVATVPVPVPARVTVSTTPFWIALKFAVTCWLALSVTVQVELLPLQPPPDHPAKEEFMAAASVRVTWVPLAKVALQD